MLSARAINANAASSFLRAGMCGAIEAGAVCVQELATAPEEMRRARGSLRALVRAAVAAPSVRAEAGGLPSGGAVLARGQLDHAPAHAYISTDGKLAAAVVRTPRVPGAR